MQSSWAVKLLLLLIPKTACGWVATVFEGFGYGKIGRTLDAGRTWQNVDHMSGAKWQQGVLVGYEEVVVVGDNEMIAMSAISLVNTTTNSSTGEWAMKINSSAWTRFPPSGYQISHNYSDVLSNPVSIRGVAFVELPGYETLVGYAAGTTGSFFSSLDGGHEWEKMFSGFIVDFNDIKCSTASCFVAGAVGFLGKTVDGGNSWEQQTVLGLTHPGNFLALALQTALRVVAVGEQGLVAVTQTGGPFWTMANSNTQGNLYAVVFFGDLDVLAVGAKFDASSSEVTAVATVSSNGGKNWAGIDLSDSLPGFYSLATVNVRSTMMLYASSRDAVYKSSNEGRGWEVIPSSKEINMNYIASFVLQPAPVLAADGILLFQVQQQYSSQSVFEYSFPVENIGTLPLHISLVELYGDRKETSCERGPYTLAPGAIQMIVLMTNLAGALPGDYAITVHIEHNGPVLYDDIPVFLRIGEPPDNNTFSWINKNWQYLLGVGVGLLLAVFFKAQKRFKMIKEYNLGKTKEYHLQFWRFGCWQKVRWHADDSSFWSSADSALDEEVQEDEGGSNGDSSDDSDTNIY